MFKIISDALNFMHVWITKIKETGGNNEVEYIFQQVQVPSLGILIRYANFLGK